MPSSQSGAKALFLFGLPDSKAVHVGGLNKKGELVYSWPGNSDFHNYIDIPHLPKNYLSIVWHAEPQRNIEKPSIVINCISDADTCGKSLEKAIALTQQIQKRWPDVPVFNPPSQIAATTRDKIYQQFHHLPGLYVPRVIRIRPQSTADILQLAAAQAMPFPFLIRECGTHQSSGLQIIRNEGDAERLERYAFDGREYYLAEFVDNKNADGLYNKARLVMVGGKLFARHFMTSPQWMTYAHIHSHYMADNTAAKQAEEHFVTHYTDIIGREALDSLHKIHDTLGLDYLGFDVAPMPDGKLLIFEINVAQNALLSIDFEKFPYMESIKNTIVSGLNHCITKKLK
jgi:glutathione synthase/RimK-type ligase-like ATP-grasp enzyme